MSTQTCTWSFSQSQPRPHKRQCLLLQYLYHQHWFVLWTVATHSCLPPYPSPFTNLTQAEQCKVNVQIMFSSPINITLHLLTLSSTCHFVHSCSVLQSSNQIYSLVTDSKNVIQEIKTSILCSYSFALMEMDSSDSLFPISWLLLPDNTLLFWTETSDVFTPSSEGTFQFLFENLNTLFLLFILHCFPFSHFITDRIKKKC